MEIDRNLIPFECYGVLVQDLPATDLDEIAEQVRRIGYATLDSGYTKDELAYFAEAFDRTRADYVQKYGEVRLRGSRELHTVRAPLIHGDPAFIRLATNQNLINVLGKLIAGKYILNQQNCVINPPGETYNQGAWHRDLPYQHFVSNTPLAVNALFCVDDFTQKNGSTFVLPSTHQRVNYPSLSYVSRNALQIEASAGQYILMDCMLFHSGGFNASKYERRAVNHMYSIPYFRPQIDFSKAINRSGLTEEQIEVLGLNFETILSVEEYLNSVEKKHAR